MENFFVGYVNIKLLSRLYPQSSSHAHAAGSSLIKICRPFQFLVFLRIGDVILHSWKKSAKLFVIKRKSISDHTFTDYSWKNNKKGDQAFCCHWNYHPTPIPRQCLIWWVISLSCLLEFPLSVCNQFQWQPRSLAFLFIARNLNSELPFIHFSIEELQKCTCISFTVFTT